VLVLRYRLVDLSHMSRRVWIVCGRMLYLFNRSCLSCLVSFPGFTNINLVIEPKLVAAVSM
jgi:preprotein translocase subunit SecB